MEEKFALACGKKKTQITKTDFGIMEWMQLNHSKILLIVFKITSDKMEYEVIYYFVLFNIQFNSISHQ